MSESRNEDLARSPNHLRNVDISLAGTKAQLCYRSMADHLIDLRSITPFASFHWTKIARDVPFPGDGMQLKGCVRRKTRQHVSIVDLCLDREWAFVHPIKENIEPTLDDVNGLIAKTIVDRQLTAAETGCDGCATHSINHKLAIRHFHARNPRRLRDVNSVFHRSGAIGKAVTRRWWRRGFNINGVWPRIDPNNDGVQT